MEAQEQQTMIGKAWLNGRIEYFTDEKGGGEVVGYHKGGAVWFRYGVLNGKVHGTGRIWYPDGTLESEVHCKAGEMHGPAHHWHPNGKLWKEENYRKGSRHGIQKRWYPDGTSWLQEPFTGGRLNGTVFKWYPNGKLATRRDIVNDRAHGFFERYANDGSLLAKEIYVRGVRMPLKKYEQFLRKELPAKDILAIPNTEVRRIFVEELGYSRLLAQMPHEVIDREGEQELVRIDWHDREEPICLVKVKCPSTGAFYTLRVPPNRTTVKSAVAWTFDVKTEEYEPLKET